MNEQLERMAEQSNALEALAEAQAASGRRAAYVATFGLTLGTVFADGEEQRESATVRTPYGEASATEQAASRSTFGIGDPSKARAEGATKRGTGLADRKVTRQAMVTTLDPSARNLFRTVAIERRDGTIELRRSYVAGKALSVDTLQSVYASDGTRFSAEDVASVVIPSRRARYVPAKAEGVRPTFRRDVRTLVRATSHFVAVAQAEYAGLNGVDLERLREDAFSEAYRLLLVRRSKPLAEGATVRLGRATYHYRAAEHAVSAVLRSSRLGLSGLRNKSVQAERSARRAWEDARDGMGEAVPIPLTDDESRTVDARMSADTSRYVNVRPSKATGSADPSTYGMARALGGEAYDPFTRLLYASDASGKPEYPTLLLIAEHGDVRNAYRARYGKTYREGERKLKARARAEYMRLTAMVDTLREAMPASASI